MTFLTTGSHLVRFDGKRFHVVTIAEIPNPKPRDWPWMKPMAGSGFGTGAALASWRTANGSGTMSIAGERPNRDNGTIARSRQGGIWTINDWRLVRLRRWQALETIPYPPFALPVCLEEDSVGQIWACTGVMAWSGWLGMEPSNGSAPRKDCRRT
jgi:hypothetical protein